MVLLNTAIPILAILIVTFWDNKRYSANQMILAGIFPFFQFVAASFIQYNTSDTGGVNSWVAVFAVVLAIISIVLVIRVLRGQPIFSSRQEIARVAVPTPRTFGSLARPKHLP
jgi:hypothetical protein